MLTLTWTGPLTGQRDLWLGSSVQNDCMLAFMRSCALTSSPERIVSIEAFAASLRVSGTDLTGNGFSLQQHSTNFRTDKCVDLLDPIDP